MGPKSKDWCPHKQRRGHRHTGKEETEIGGMQLKAKQRQGWPGATEARKRQEKILSQSLQWEHSPVNTLISDF